VRLRPVCHALVLAAVLSSLPASGAAQILRLSSLHVPEDAAPGPWVAYRVVTQTRNFPPREVTQRAAIVSAEGIGNDAGVWIELKTVDPHLGTRIDRGFFARARGGGSGEPGSASPPGLELRRTQQLQADGKLYEYPPHSGVALRAEEEITTLGLFEVSSARPPAVDTLGVDTLRVGPRTLAATAVRKRWVGFDEWRDPADTTRVKRVLLTLIQDRCPEVPLTGFTHSVLEVRTAEFAPYDTLGLYPLPPADPSGPQPVLSRVELTLGDLGTGAVPEVTQEPEPAPELPEPESGRDFPR
jgi:hypothetical protein